MPMPAATISTGLRRLLRQEEVAPHAGDGEGVARRSPARAPSCTSSASWRPGPRGTRPSAVGRSSGADAMLNSRRVPRASGCRCGTSSSRYWPGRNAAGGGHGKSARCTVGVSSARDSSVSFTAARTEKANANARRLPISRARSWPRLIDAEVDGPAGEDADDGGDGELLPPPRRQRERLGQHERAEEQERRGHSTGHRTSTDVDRETGRLVLRRGAQHADRDRDHDEHGDDPHLLGAHEHGEPQHDHGPGQRRRAHPPRRGAEGGQRRCSRASGRSRRPQRG